jgi:GNAT superfamily N-acetyltransferase
MFDVPLEARSARSFSVEVPGRDEAWQIGLIVGPSGSGKSTIARHAFAESLAAEQSWPDDRAVVDCFGTLSAKQITGLLTAVGFGSPPAWVRPYRALSRGEQFRCDLARALGTAFEKTQAKKQSEQQGESNHHRVPLVVFDEFTSVVDRNVAQIGSAAISKSIRGGHLPCRFVAVTCHYDVAEWLEPDWVVDMQQGTCLRRRLRRPRIQLDVHRCHHRNWKLFAPHHYLSAALNRAARCYTALWNGVPVAFCATLAVIGRKNFWRISRIVTLPDFQGVGIGMRLAETVCQLHQETGCRINVIASHPALLAHCARSPLWRLMRVKRNGSGSTRRFITNYRASTGRSVVSFEYLGARP